VLMCYKTDESRDFSTTLRSARNDKNTSLEWKRVLRPQEPDGGDTPDLQA